jgi:anti-sigma regulatory factor (Ser/Thr protein kinase)
MQIVLNGEPAERASVVRGLEEFCRQHEIPRQVMNAADVALEEHLTNVLHYGYEAGAPHRVVVDLKLDNGSLCVDVADDGKSYDPLARPPVDTSLPLAEKPIGGLGVHLMRQFMDELSYAREAGKNVLRMRKRIGTATG